MKRGLALVLVVGVLAVLAVLGSAFAVLSRLERKAAAQRVLGTQALLLSRSGLEDAAARLAMGQDPDATPNRYGGEDWDLSATSSILESSNEVYRPGNLDREACPVQHAMRPSYFERISSGNPVSIDVDGRRRGVSGRLSTGTWALKVIPQAGFFVNGGDPARTPVAGDYNMNLRRMLGILARALGEEGHPLVDTDGFSLVDRRPPTGWSSWEQIRDLALGGSRDKLDAIRPYLSLRSWVDLKVIRPNAVASMDTKNWTSWADMRLAHRSPTTNLPELDFERIPLTPAGKVVGRAPVNLEWARKRKPALLALLGNLDGLSFSGAGFSTTPPRIGTTNRTFLPLSWVSTDPPHQIADYILSCSSEIRTWRQFDLFCNTIPTSIPSWYLIRAAFNPNTDLNKFSPTPLLRKYVDKSDLLVYSTELSLLPLHDHEIDCAGRVQDRGGRTLAARTLKAVLPRPEAFRITTQKELVCGNLGRLDLAGDETDLRLPGQAGFLGFSNGLGRTWGHTLPGMGGSGLGLQTYPEPVVNAGGGLTMKAADYDGCLKLATVETAGEDCYSVSSAVQDMMMLARFDDGFDPDVHDAAQFQNLTDTSQCSTAELDHGLWHPTKPVSIYPDGCYSEQGYVPAFPDRGNANGFHGLLSFWLKRNNIGQMNPRTRWIHWTWYGSTIPNDEDNTQCFYFGPGYYSSFIASGLHLWVEACKTGPFCEEEPDQSTPAIPSAWSLYTIYYDFQADQLSKFAVGIVNDGSRPEWLVDQPNYSNVFTAKPADANTDITLPDVYGVHRISLGGRQMFRMEGEMDVEDFCYYNNGADSTFDELAIYDFGRDETVAMDYASERYKEGRFYKGWEYVSLTQDSASERAGTWLSAPIRLPQGTRLRSVSWTWLPLTGTYAEVELADAAGSGYLWPGSRSTLGPGWRADRQDWTVGREVGDPFRLHAVFRRTAATDPNTPLTDSPILDDLTLLYEPTSGPRLLDFRSGE